MQETLFDTLIIGPASPIQGVELFRQLYLQCTLYLTGTVSRRPWQVDIPPDMQSFTAGCRS
jgi:hypothetical protein